MTAYQVDECTDSKRFVESCTRQGLVDLWRFPKKLKQKKDACVLDVVLSSGRTLVTTDRAIHFDNVAHVPDIHPGILIIASASPSKHITVKYIIHTLSRFKEGFPRWYETSLQNSIVVITEDSAEVWIIVQGNLKRVDFIQFSQEDWQVRLANLLAQNARIGAIS